MAVRADIELQQGYDRARSGLGSVLMARMAAVVTAQRAVRDGENGATPALRQALIDLAAICELLANEQPPLGEPEPVKSAALASPPI